MKNTKSLSRRFVLLSAVASLSAFFAKPASALLAVIDPVNLPQTTITALKQVAAYTLQIKQWEETIKSNMAKLKDLESIQSNETAFGIAASLLGYSTQLEDTLKDGMTVAETFKSWYGASKKSPEEFMRVLAKERAAGDQRVGTLLDHYQANGAAIQEAHTSLQKISAAVKDVNGPTEGLQAVVASLGVLIKQQSSMMSLAQLDTLDKAQQEAKKNQSKAGEDEWQRNYDKRINAAKN